MFLFGALTYDTKIGFELESLVQLVIKLFSMAWHFQDPGFFRVLIHHYLPIYYLQTHLKILFLDGHDLNWSCPKARFGLLAFTVRWKYRNIFIGLLSKANFDVKYMDRAVKVKNMKKALFLSSIHNCFDVLPREDLSILQLLF